MNEKEKNNTAIIVTLLTGVFGLASILLSHYIKEKVGGEGASTSPKDSTKVSDIPTQLLSPNVTINNNPVIIVKPKEPSLQRIDLLTPKEEMPLSFDVVPEVKDQIIKSTIEGYIWDKGGEPIEGVKVEAKGLYVLTNSIGYYNLNIEFTSRTREERLSFSKAGYFPNSCFVNWTTEKNNIYFLELDTLSLSEKAK